MGTLRFRSALCRAGFLALLLVVLQGAQCPQIPELRETAVSVVSDQFIELEFEARGSINSHAKSDTIRIAELLDDIEDAGIDPSVIDSVWIARILYGVTAYNETETNREIVDGQVEVNYSGAPSPAVLFDGVDQMVYPLLGELIAPPLEAGGIDYLNDLLDAVLTAIQTGAEEEFVVSAQSSGISEPVGRDTDFDWRVRIHYQIVGRASVEVPDL